MFASSGHQPHAAMQQIRNVCVLTLVVRPCRSPVSLPHICESDFSNDPRGFVWIVSFSTKQNHGHSKDLWMLIAAASWKAPRTHHVFSRVPSPRPACLMQLNEVVASSNLRVRPRFLFLAGVTNPCWINATPSRLFALRQVRNDVAPKWSRS